MARGGLGSVVIDISDEERVGKNAFQYLGPNKERYLLVIAVVDFIVWTLCYLEYFSFNMTDFKKEDINDYNMGESLFDLWVMGILRSLLLFTCLKNFEMYYPTFWILFIVIIISVAKLIVFTEWDHADLTALLVCQLVLGLAELLIVKQIRDVAMTPISKAQAEKKTISTVNFLKILSPYFWPDGITARWKVFFTWFFLVSSKVSVIFSPLFIGEATRKMENGKGVPVFEICMYAGLGFAERFFKESQQVTYQTVKQTAFAQLTEYTFRHMHNLSLDWHLRKKMGNVLRSLDRGVSSADTVVTYLFLYLFPSMAECLVVFIIFYTVFDLPWLSSIAFIALTGYIMITVKITLWRTKFRAATNKHDNDYHDKLTDSLINYETVKYFANEDYEADRFGESVKAFQKFSVATQMSLSLLNTSQTFIIKSCLCLCLIVTAYEVNDGDMDLGDFVSINIYLIQLFVPLSFLGTVYSAIVQAFVDMQNLSELLAVDQDVKDDPKATLLAPNNKGKGVKLEFKDVSFSYPTQPEGSGLKGVSFTVAPDTTTAIVGATGAGKTTIGRLLFRFYDVTGGGVFIDGHNIRDVTQKSLRSLVGVVPQDTVMFNESLLHNIQYGRTDATKEECVEAARAAQILPFIERQTEKWECVVGERGLKLSGGEKQRVAIARCLLKNPPLVLLDEATSALDSKTENEIQESLIRLGQSRTTLVIAHRLSTIKHANQIIVMSQGRVVEKGTHQELLEKKGEYYELWTVQEREVNEDSKTALNDVDDTEQAVPAVEGNTVKLHFDTDVQESKQEAKSEE